jgi:chemotaxis response regulator CheB
MPDTIRVVIADDHAIFRYGLRKLIETQRDFTLVGEAVDGITAVQLVRETKPDVLLLDLTMPLMSGLDVVAELERMRSEVRTILLVAAIEMRPPADRVPAAVSFALFKIRWEDNGPLLALIVTPSASATEASVRDVRQPARTYTVSLD